MLAALVLEVGVFPWLVPVVELFPVVLVDCEVFPFVFTRERNTKKPPMPAASLFCANETLLAK